MAVTAQETTRVTVTDEDLAHVGPGALAGAFLRRFWHPICVAGELPIGRPRPIRILGENYTLYRGESGQPHILGFRCAHRGNQLSLGWVEGDSLRCYYHGWRYDETGQCDRQPHEEHSFCDRIKIPSYPCQEYLGLLFGYFGPQPAPALPRYPVMEQEDYVVEADVKLLPYNYFQSIENNIDSGHVPFVHRRYHNSPYIADADDIDPVEIQVRETDYGVENGRRRSDGEWTYAHFLMPNIHCIRIAPHRGSRTDDARHHYSWRTPIDDEQTLWFNAVAERPEGHSDKEGPTPDLRPEAERILRGEASIHEIPNTPWVTNFQDYVSQWGQGIVADRSGDHLGRGDAGVSLLRSIYKREMQALAEGGQSKEWRGYSEPISTRE